MVFADTSFLGYVIPLAVVGILVSIDLFLAVALYKVIGLSFVKCFFNFLWATFIGWPLALYFYIAGAFCCISIIFIPIGLQMFKFGQLAFWPFGYSPRFTSLNTFKTVVNVLWAIFFGWENAVTCYVTGALLCATLIFIPCGLQLFKFGRLLLLPLGTTIEKD